MCVAPGICSRVSKPRGVLLDEGSDEHRARTPSKIKSMKTKLTLLLAALSVAGVASIATAGPDTQDFALRRQITESQRAASQVADSGPVKYVANSSGKGGTVVAVREPGATNIALFKSSKAKGCDGAACCAKTKH
jgi:hypothetical protein